MLAAILTAGLLASTPSVPAQGVGRPNIFNTDNLPSGDGATTEPGSKRARLIRVNSPVLAADESPIHQPAPANFNLESSRLELNLFNDTIVTAAMEKTLYRNGSNFVSKGVVDGWADSKVIVVAEGDVMAATIDMPGYGTYQIRYAGNGLHKVIELDKSIIPGCGPLRRAPAKPRPIKIRKKNSPPVVGTEPSAFVPKASAFVPASMFSEDLLAAIPPIEPDASSNTNIDVMVVYTAAARTGAGGVAAMNTLIDLAVAEANEAFDNSLIPVTLNLVFRGEVSYTETANAATDLTRLQNANDGYMDAVHTWRNQYGADLVCLFTETMNTYAGLGYLMSNVSTNFSSYSFSVVRRVYAAGTFTFAHELGHNLGCAHDRQNSSSQGAFPYSYGYRFVGSDNNTYRTVMAYAPGARIPYFSNPNVSYLGTPTGVAVGATNAADNATSISNTMSTVSAFRSPVVILSFASVSNSVYETNGTITIDVRRSSVTNLSVIVDYATADGTALDGSDYVSTNGTLTFATGETNKTITVAVLDDAIRESTKSFTLSLSNPSVGSLSSSNTTAYILDDDSSSVGFASTSVSVSENTNVVTIDVVRTGVTNTAVTVNYFTTNSTAAAGSDFIATNGILSFAAGETTQTVSVVVLNDAIAENNESFLVRLRSPTNTALTASTNFTVTITTNDSAVFSFSAAAASTNEGAGTITLTVNRSGTTNNAATVDFATTNVTATAGSDYAATNGTLSFLAGETSKTFTVDLTDDNTQESTESFRAILSNPSDARIGTGTNTVSLTDNDASSVAFTTNAVAVSETNGTLILTVIRSGATNTAVSVDYATTNVTAAAGSDYTATNGTLSFAAGETTNTISIDIADDATQEASESFRVRLGNASNTALGVGTNTVTISDDDTSTTGFTVAAISVSEDTNSVTLTVVRSGATNTAVSVNFATLTNGTATAGSDFRATNGILSFAAGATTNTFALAVINDALGENSETINVRLSSPTNCTLGTSNLTVTITTNDSAILSFTSATNTVSESNGTITVIVLRTGTTNNAVTVDFATTNVTAIAGSDYTATNGVLSFAAGVTSNSFTVDITDNDTQESAEAFRVVLSNPSDARITIGTNTVTVTDDDSSSVGFTTGTTAVSETNGTLTLTIVRSGATNTAASVDFTTTNISATAGSDYTATNGTLNFAAGETTNTISIEITDNQVLETNEVFRVVLSNPSNTSLGIGTNVVTIADDDANSVAFTVSALSVSEDTNNVTIAVVRTGATNTTVSVRYATLTTGTASAGTDYRATNGLFVFNPGETTNTFSLAILNDALAENNETIALRLSNPTNTTLGTSDLVITITTNDSSVLSFSVATNSVGETNGTLTIVVLRTGTTNNAVTVDFATTNVTASSASDYAATNGTLSFPAGVTSNSFTVDITDDATQESSESFRIVLSNPTDARIGLGTNTVSIADDDGSTVALTTNAVTVSETNGTLTLTVVRSGATNTAVTVDFTTTNVTAVAGSDYSATNGTLSFAAGETTNTISIDITDNTTQESTETFQVRLSNASNTSVGIGTNTVTITDEDSSMVAFTVSAMSVAEDTNSVVLTVVRTGATNTAVSVNYATLTNGTATAASDYRATNGVLSFAAGLTTNTITLAIINDTVSENNETINVRLTSPTNCSIGTSNLVVTITTNDSAILSFSSATNLVSETNGTLTVIVLRTGTTNNGVTVDFTTTNVTASSAGDYAATNGTLSFAAGVTSNSFTVDITNDATQESTESFRLVLSNPGDARITIGTNTVTVADDDSSTVGFTASTTSVSETNGTLTLTVVRSGATNTAVSVDFTTTNATALAGSDYTATNGTLSFAAGETTNTISIDIVDNLSQEPSEVFQVRLSNASNTSLGTGTNAVTITDEDAASVGFTVSAISVTEDTNTVTLTVVRTGATNTAVSVNFATVTNGTATAGSDYRATNGVLSFAAGVATNTFALAIINDAVAENNETVVLRLSSPTNCSLGTSNLTVTITTNDSAVLSFTASTNSVSETNGTITVVVLRTGTTNNAVTVDFATTNVTASSASDYVATNGTLSFAAGVASNSFTVDITDDDVQESTETFRIVLSNPTDGRLGTGTNTVTIADDDGSSVAFTTNAVTVSETNGTLTLIVIRSGATNTAVTVDFATTNVTAFAGSDYTATNGTLSFAAGETTNTISIDITDNLTQESTETFQIRLSNVSNTSFGVGTNTVTITDEDTSTVAFTVAAISVAEDTNSITLTVVRTGATNTAVSVNYATTTNGTATAVSDYRATNGVLSFAAGVTTNTFALAIVNDALAENSETVIVRLSSPTNCSLGTSNLTVTITTNDSSILSFSVATNSVSETNGTLTLVVLRTGTTNNAVTVDFTTTNVTASSASDYSATNGTLSFAAGVASNSFTVTITDDATQESAETLRVVLSNPTDGRVGLGTNTIVIADDDVSSVAFTTNAVTVSETNGTLTLTIIRSGATNTAVTVDFATTNLTAVAGSDYTATNGTLGFAAGETTNTISIDITDNVTQESTETFQVRLGNASNTSVGVGTNTVTITDEDSGTVGFTVAAISVAEDTNSVTLTVVRTGATNTAVSVNFATATNGTATVTSDYRATNGVLSFAAGVTTNTFALAIVNDALAENSETVIVRLSSPTNCSLGTSNLTVTITTNDSAILSFSVATNSVSETNGTLTLIVLRTGTTNNSVSVDFATTNVTASSASDYSATNGTLSFAAGVASNSFTVTITDDATQEAAETLRVVLSNPTDGRIGLGTNTIAIADDDGSTVAFTTNAVTISETNGTLTLTVLRSGATNTAVTVDFATTNISATAGSDYTATNGTLNFAAGETTNTISIDITDNVTQESSESFQVRLGNASNTTVGVGTNTVTITDEDSGTVGFTVAAISVAEDTNNVTLTVVRTGATNTAVSVNFATTTNGTAAITSDYRATNGVLSFAAGVTTNTFVLAIVNDALAENNETVVVRLSSPTNCSLGTSNLTVTITTNDSAILSFSSTTNTVSETNGTLTVVVLRTGTTNNAVTVDFTTTNVTASSAGDYAATNGTLSFAAGVTSNSFTVDITDDATQESTESFRLVLSNPTDARLGVGTNTVVLTDDDGSTVGFTTNAVTVAETNGTLTLTVIRSGATNTAVTVDFTTTNVSATAGSDYTATNGTLSFAAGETTNTIDIDITDNQLLEATETFWILLGNASNTSLGVASNTVTITDDDVAAVGFAASAVSVAEDTNSVTIYVVRTGTTNTTVSVNYSTLTNGTATAGSDYRATNGVLVFAPGVTTNTFALAIINDLVAENNETVNVRLSNPTNMSLGTSNLTVTITTNDSAILSFSSTTNTVSETNGTLTVVVLRSGTTNNAVTVDFTTTNVTASSASDYSATNGTLSFAAGVTSNSFTVDITNDAVQESSESFRLVLSNPTDARVGAGTNTVTVSDDDGSTVAFTTNAVTVAETNGTLTFTVIRSGATNTAVTVDFTTANASAVAGSDYAATNGTLSFAAGETTNTIDIDITDDATQEGAETFQVRLSNASNTSLGTSTNTVTVSDDDTSSVAFTVTALSVAEDTNSVTLMVVRTGSTNTAISVNYATLTNGTATSGSDFRATNGVLSFAAGVTTNTFAVGVINDLAAEGGETFNVRLSSPTNCSLGSSNLTVTITTNDSAILSFSSTTNLVSETNGTLTIVVLRTGTTNNAVTVDFATTNGTATSSGDYSSTNGTLSFAAGVTSNSFTVDIADDATQESTEFFRVLLSNPIDATIATVTNTMTISDDDGSTVALTANAVTVSETNGTLTLTVIRSGATNTAVSVDFTTTNITATAGTDYTATNGTLSFAAGETTNTISIAITDNATQEGTETFLVRLSNASNTSLGTDTNTVSITDDDGSSTGFTVNSIVVAENTNTVTITVVRTGATNTAVSVSFTNLPSSTATAGSDFGATNGILSFAAGVTTNTFTVSIVNDSVAETNEFIALRLINATNTSLATSNLVITITTNDSAIVSWSAATTNIAEAGGTLTFTVNRTGTTNNAVTVDFTTTNVTATGGADYTATNGTISFAAGETSHSITVDVNDDDLQEANETFRVVLSNPTDATLGIGTNTVTITDDDGSTITFTTNAVTLAETNDSVTLTVVRSGATNTAVAIDFTTTNVTATASDYTATNGTLIFAPGETTNTITVALSDDLLYEGTETFRVILSGITNSSMSIGTNTVSIADDDVAYLGFTVSADSVNELDSTITVTVERTGSTNTAVSVAYATTNLTATAGVDYTATNGVLSFAPGETNQTITVAIAFDDDIESSETFRIRLFSLTNAAPAATTNLTITIDDAFGGTPPPAAMVSISSINAGPNNELRVRVTGPIGAGVVIEATTNLTSWVPVATNTITSGTWDWTTPIDPAVPARYFRVVPPR